MKSFEFDITIVGGGCLGASILFELTRLGFGNIGLLDKGRKTVSATASSGGMLRVFHESPEHLDLALSNHFRLKAFEAAGVFTEKMMANGSLYFFHKNRLEAYLDNINKMKVAGYPAEVVEAKEGSNRFPEYNWKTDELAIFEPLGTQLSPGQFTEDLLLGSQARGANVVDNFEVLRIGSYLDRYRICGEESSVTTKILILAGGARLIPQLAALGLNLPFESVHITTHYAEKIQSDLVLPNYFDRETLSFGRFGGLGSLDSVAPVILSDPEDQRMQKCFWREPILKKSNVDCYAPNRQGFAGRVPGLAGLIVASGWGGTGFKFALEVGKRVARVVEHELPDRRVSYAEY